MRTALRSTFLTHAASCSLLAACHGAVVPNQVFTKPAPARAPARAPGSVAGTSGPWSYRPSAQPQGFIVDQRAVVVIRLDTSTQTDTVSARAEIDFTVTPSTGGVNGSVGAFFVQGPGHAAAAPRGLVLPFPFRAQYSARGVQLEFTTPREAAPCSSTALAVAQSLRDLWFRPPDTLRTGLTWEDSSSYVVCRDGIPLRATIHRLFRVSGSAERQGRLLLAISRMSRTVLDGTGAQFGEPVTVSGAGSGQLVYDFDPVRGEVVSASGSVTLDFSLRSRLRTQVVRQTMELRISRS